MRFFLFIWRFLMKKQVLLGLTLMLLGVCEGLYAMATAPVCRNLYAAALVNDFERVQEFIRDGVDVNALLVGSDLFPEEKEGQTVRPEDLLLILQPIVAGSIINAKDNTGHTALWHARHGYHAKPAIAEMLENAGAIE